MKSHKELTPVVYNESGVKILRNSLRQPDGLCFTLHWHDRMELLLIQQGSMDLYLNEKYAATAHAGEVAIIGPRQPHTAIAGAEGVLYDVLMFEVDAFLNSAPATARHLRPLLEKRLELQPVSSLLCDVATTIVQQAEHKPLQTVGLVYQLLGQLLETCVVSYHAPGPADQRFSAVVEHVNTHYTEPLSTRTLSSQFGYDEAYFCRRFKKATGLNVLRYVEVLRLELAQKLLRETDAEISRVAQQCGYEDVCYFSHRFHKHVGQAPTAFRRGMEVPCSESSAVSETAGNV